MNTKQLAKEIRLLSLRLCYLKKTSHIGGALSVADILAVLYGEILIFNSKEPMYPKRDRLFFSKGHASVAMYAVLSLKNFFSKENLIENFTKNGQYFTSHVNHNIPGIELSTGSLGHALGVACGVALAEKIKKLDFFTYVILSDGELNEGSNWESIMFAAQNNLNKLIIVIDYNKIQSFGSTKDVMDLEPLKNKFLAFNWDVKEIPGHNIDEIKNAFNIYKNSISEKPKCIIAHTIKGKGIKFMENELSWHYKSPNSEEFRLAKEELNNNA